MNEDQDKKARMADRGDSDGSAESPARPMSTRGDLVLGLKDFIARNPQILGGVDIFNIDYLHPLERAGVLAAVLSCVVAADHRPVVSAILIVAGPETDLDAAHAQAWGAMLHACEMLAGREMTASAKEWFRARFKQIGRAHV